MGLVVFKQFGRSPHLDEHLHFSVIVLLCHCPVTDQTDRIRIRSVNGSWMHDSMPY